MTHPRRRGMAIAAAIAFAVAAPGALAAGKPASSHFDRFIVRFKDASAEHSSTALRQRLLDGAGRKQGLHVGQLRRMAVGADVVRTHRALDAREAKAFLASLRADPRVAYAEVDARVHATFSPNDTHFPIQWHYTDAIAGIRLPAAWDLSNGAGQVVAVLDTGAVAHSDLAANLVTGYDFISDATTANDGGGRDNDPSDPGDWNAAGECDGADAADSSWHGTHVAGTIAAVTNNAKGVAGVAYGAKVQPVRVLGKCGGSGSDIADAIVWASGGSVAGVPANPTPAKVINLSLGGPGACGASTQAAINTAVANGSTVVIAAGNDNSDASGFQPANCSNSITVAALDRTGARASYSNYGLAVELAAPGGGGGDPVWSTLNDGTTVPGAENYAGYNGTSMATPHVAGVAALAQARAGGTLTPPTLASLLQATARALPVACAQGCGVGLLDATAAVTAAGAPFLVVNDATSVAEGNSGTHTVTFQVKLSQALGVPVSFNLATANGTATAGSDYVARASTPMSIPAGQTSANFTVTVNGDATGETDETFFVNLTNAVGASALDTQGRHVILNDDNTGLGNGVPVTNLSGATGSKANFYIDVPSGATNLNVTIDGPNGDADLYLRQGAAPTVDLYDCRSWEAGSLELCTVPAPVAGRYYIMIDGYEAYTGLTLTASYSSTGPLPNLSINDATVAEGDSGTKLMTFTATLSQATSSPVTFSAYTTSGSASQTLDYTGINLSLSIPAGQLSKTFTVSILGDTQVEADETFTVTIWGATNAQISKSFGVGKILNDDTLTLRIDDANITEGHAGTKVLQFRAWLNGTSAAPVNFSANTQSNTATVGSDFVGLPVTPFAIPAGQLSTMVNVTINGDTAIEGNETYFVNLSAVSGATLMDGQGIGTITNDDPAAPGLTIADASIAEGNSGTKLLTFTVSLTQASASTVAFSANTQGNTATVASDFVAMPVTAFSIPAGQLAKTFTVTINGDTAIESDEVFYVWLSSVSGATLMDGQAVGRILNDDTASLPGLRILDASTTEGNSGTKLLTFTVTLTQASASAVNFSANTQGQSAAAGVDFVAMPVTAFSIAAGQVSKTFTVAINGDTTIEANETFFVWLSSVSGASLQDGQAVGTITNDDLPGLRINDASVIEGNSGTKLISFVVTLTAASPTTVSFNGNTQGQTAAAGSDFTGYGVTAFTIPAGQTSRLVSVIINGDTTVEGHETFFVWLSSPTGATLLDGQGVGTIANDD